jgi:hypothetical protein
MLVFPDPIKHDGFKLSPAVEKIIPRAYQLQNNWTISKRGLRFLRHGPLISESGETILIPAYGWIASLIIKFERPLGIIGSLASIVAFLFLIKAIVEKIVD